MVSLTVSVSPVTASTVVVKLVVAKGQAALALDVEPVALSVEEGAEQLVEDRVLVSQVLLSYSISMLERIDEDNAERKTGTNEQDGDIHQIEVRANVMRVALMGQLRDREQAEQAECKQDRAKRYVHELGHAVNYLVEPLTELIANHESQCEHETDGC